MRIISFITLLAAVIYVQGKATDGYILNTSANKSYKVMYESKTWSKAEEVCESEDARLAVPKSQDEFLFIQKLVRGMYYPNITGTMNKLVVWIGINNIEDYKVWKNIDGENIADTGFHQWSGNNGKGYSDDPAEPHCVVIDAVNPGLRDWWCHLAQPFICEKYT